MKKLLRLLGFGGAFLGAIVLATWFLSVTRQGNDDFMARKTEECPQRIASIAKHIEAANYCRTDNEKERKILNGYD